MIQIEMIHPAGRAAIASVAGQGRGAGQVAEMQQLPDRVVFRADLCKAIGVKSECIRRWMKNGKLPKPDVAISRKTMGGRLSILQAVGIGIV